jgi:hypothetical protein
MQLTTLFSDSKLATRTTDKGRVTFLSQKEYGLAHNLKGQTLKRAHHEYRLAFGTTANASLSSAMAKGAIVVRSVSPTASGFTVAFDDVAKLKAPATKAARAFDADALRAKLSARGLSDSDIADILSK